MVRRNGAKDLVRNGLGVLFFFVVVLTCPSSVFAGPAIEEFAVYGAGEVYLNPLVTIQDGLVGSSGNIHLGTGDKTKGVLGGGALDGDSLLAIGSHVVFNGSIVLGGTNSIAGNLDSGGDIVTGVLNKVLGNVTAAGTITFGGSSAVGGTVAPFGVPASFTPPVLPPPADYIAGGPDIIKPNGETTTLPPGTYGALSLGSLNILNLSSGAYYFNRIHIANGLTLNLNLTGGVIWIFVVGDVYMGSNMKTFLTGGGAEDIFAETRGNWQIGNASTWYGTIFAPNGDIHIGQTSDLMGAFWARNRLFIDSSTSVGFILFTPPAAPVEKYCVFGKKGLQGGSNTKVDGGPAGSNYHVSVAGLAFFQNGVEGGATFATGGNLSVVKDVIFNGDVTLGNGSHVKGNVESGGNIKLGSMNTVEGDVVAAGFVTMGGFRL